MNNIVHKKILFLNANLQSGGAERQMVTVARLLKQRGHDVSFYCYDKGDFYGHLLAECDIPVVWEYTFPNLLKRFICTRRYIRRGGYDAVISFLQPVNVLNVFAALGGKKWKVITGLRYCPAEQVKIAKEKNYLRIQDFSDYIVSNSELAKKRWVINTNRKEDKIKVIYNHVIISNLHSEYHPKQDGKLHLVVAASYQYLKNPLGLVEALKLMTPDERKKIIIDWYGSKNASNAYQDTMEAINSFGLSDDLRLHEATKDINDIMQSSDAVMLLSKEEGLPNAICEGMMLGKPIIMTRVSDYDVLVDETNGVLCDWDNPKTIKDAIIKMSNLPIEKIMEMGVISNRKAEQLFSSNTIALQWEDLL